MPVLNKEPSLFPETLLDPTVTADEIGNWMVLYTKPRQEKSLARDLLRQRISFYLPLVKKTLQYGQRRLFSHAPLFGGYVFMHGAEAERIASLATNRVLRVIPVSDTQRLAADLQQVYRLIAANVPLTVESRIQAGTKVRVKSGPLMGVEGIVLQRRAETRLLVAINFLQQGASVEIEDFQLEPLT